MDEVTDGILRKADLPIVSNNQCRQYLDMTSDNKSKAAYSGFLCAGGVWKEESCYVRERIKVYLFSIVREVRIGF